MCKQQVGIAQSGCLSPSRMVRAALGNHLCSAHGGAGGRRQLVSCSPLELGVHLAGSPPQMMSTTHAAPPTRKSAAHTADTTTRPASSHTHRARTTCQHSTSTSVEPKPHQNKWLSRGVPRRPVMYHSRHPRRETLPPMTDVDEEEVEAPKK